MDPESIYLETDSIPWRESPYPGVRWKKLFVILHRPIEELEPSA